MNILIIGKPYENLISEIKTSKLLNKLYTAQNERYGDLPNIVYDRMEELISKAKALEKSADAASFSAESRRMYSE